MKGQARAFRWSIAIAIAYGLWSIVLTAPVAFRMADGLPKDWGDPLLNTWILAWETRVLLERPWGLFDAPIFYPHQGTLAYSEPLLGILPFAFPFMLATGIPALGYNVAFLFSFWTAALGMAHLVRASGGRRRAAFIAGLLFAAAPYRFAHLIHLQLLYMGWIPLAMAALIRYVRRPRWRRAADLTLAILLMALSSWHLAVFGGLLLGVLTAFLAWGRRISPLAWRGLGIVGIVCGLGIGIVAGPYLRIAPALSQVRAVEVTQHAAWPMDWLAASPELRLLGPLTAPLRAPGHSTHEVQLYIGATALAAAVLGIREARAREARPLRGTALVGIAVGVLMALGPVWSVGPWRIPGPYAAVVALFPGVTLIRASARWSILALIGLYAMAGVGLDRLLRGQRRWMALGGIGLGLLEGWAVPIPIVSLPRLADLPPAYHWLARQPGSFAILELPVFLPIDDRETFRMYAGLLHRKPLVIAYSGYIPPDIREIRKRLHFFPKPAAVETIIQLARIGVRYLLIDASKEEFRDFYPQGLCQVARDPHFTYIGYMQPHYIFEIQADPDIPSPSIMKPVMAKFGNIALLQAYGFRQISPEQAEVWLIWTAGPDPHGNYSIAVHALDETGQLQAQRDGPPRNGGYLFDCWRPGEQIVDRRILSDPAGRLQQVTRLGVAIYEWPSLERVPVESPWPSNAGMLILPIPILH